MFYDKTLYGPSGALFCLMRARQALLQKRLDMLDDDTAIDPRQFNKTVLDENIGSLGGLSTTAIYKIIDLVFESLPQDGEGENCAYEAAATNLLFCAWLSKAVEVWSDDGIQSVTFDLVD